MRLMYKILSVAILLAYGMNSHAQEIVDGNTNTWFLFFAKTKFADKWSNSTELHERTGDFLSDQATFIFRPSIDYHLNNDVEFSLGYSFLSNEPYEPYNQLAANTEHNIWEQALLFHRVGGVVMQHRFREEHRWVESFAQENDEVVDLGYQFSNRFRYRFTITFDVLKLNEEKGSAIIANIFDEIWILQDDNLMFTQFARNWLYMGLGYKFNSSTNVQLAYMNQNDSRGADYIKSPIIQLSFFKNFDLTKDFHKKRPWNQGLF